jgi:choline dehydrogenase-like flavoprotein
LWLVQYPTTACRTSVLWGRGVARFVPSDFRVKSLYGVADDWPFTYEEIAPYYDLLSEMVGTSGLAGDPALPPGLEHSMPRAPSAASAARPRRV